MSVDEQRIGEVVDAAYEALAFEAGDEPDWQQFNRAFHSAALLALRVFPADADVSVLGLRDYADSQMRNDLGDEGYSETPGRRAVDVIGDVAVVRQDFTMNFQSGPVPAVDVFSLVRTAGDWRIVCVVSDVVRR